VQLFRVVRYLPSELQFRSYRRVPVARQRVNQAISASKSNLSGSSLMFSGVHWNLLRS
jgi:hypothetical protein